MIQSINNQVNYLRYATRKRKYIKARDESLQMKQYEFEKMELMKKYDI